MEPQISVIMPVYNAGQYLALAIESVLGQTFTDFELLLINDGSTDNSKQVIASFTDNRIKVLDNEGNKGLVYSLNRGIAAAIGKYIARMDADDICLPDRFQLQYDYLERHTETGLVAGYIHFINEQGDDRGVWALDRKADSPQRIKRYMSSECCIAHPTIMARATWLSKFPYDSRQKAIEDYDLWLRLLAHGMAIAKLNTPVLLYRVHDQSVTQVDNKQVNVFFKIAKCKRLFLATCIREKKINIFTVTVFFKMLADYVKGVGKSIKKRIVS